MAKQALLDHQVRQRHRHRIRPRSSLLNAHVRHHKENLAQRDRQDRTVLLDLRVKQAKTEKLEKQVALARPDCPDQMVSPDAQASQENQAITKLKLVRLVGMGRLDQQALPEILVLRENLDQMELEENKVNLVPLDPKVPREMLERLEHQEGPGKKAPQAPVIIVHRPGLLLDTN